SPSVSSLSSSVSPLVILVFLIYLDINTYPLTRDLPHIGSSTHWNSPNQAQMVLDSIRAQAPSARPLTLPTVARNRLTGHVFHIFDRPRQLCRFQCHRRVLLRNPLSTLTRKAMPTLDATSTSCWPATTILRCDVLNLPDPSLPELAHLPQIFRVAEITTLVALMCGLATSAGALNVLEASAQMKRVSVEFFSVVMTQTLTS
ncbi:hypothetical protein GQ607_002168, partial [Colletotrichum asianum]